MVRYAQFCELPCDPTPEQSIHFQEEYKKVKGIISKNALTTKMQNLFVNNFEETTKLYSLVKYGTHTQFLLTKNKLKNKIQMESITQLSNLSEYLAYKTQEFKHLENSLKASLQEEFRNLVENIKESINKVCSQYKRILKSEFQILKQETEKQNKIIKTQLKKLQKGLDKQILKKRKLDTNEIAEIAGISSDQVFGYQTFFKMLTPNSLLELQKQERSLEGEVVIDESNVKKVNCNQLWYLVELTKTRKGKCEAKGSSIFGAQDQNIGSNDLAPQTFIEREQVLNGFQQFTFKTETKIVEQLASLIAKKTKSSKESLNDSNVTNSKYSSDEQTLYEFFKDKLMKNLMRASQSKIQAQFVKFNQGFKFGDFVQSKANRNPIKSYEVEDNASEKQQMYQFKKMKKETPSENEQMSQFKMPKKQIYAQQEQTIQLKMQKVEKSPEPNNCYQKCQVSQIVENPKKNPLMFSFSRDESTNQPGDSYEILRKSIKKEAPSYDRPRRKDISNQYKAERENTIIDKIYDEKSNFSQSIQDQPLVPLDESSDSQPQSQFHYESEDKQERKRQAQEQYNEYVKRMRMQQEPSLELEEKTKQKQRQRLQQQKMREAEQNRKYENYQRKLNQQYQFKPVQTQNTRKKQQLDQLINNRKTYYRNMVQKEEPVYRHDFFKKDAESTKVLQEWKQSRLKPQKQEQRNFSYAQEFDQKGYPLYERQKFNYPLPSIPQIPGVDMEQQKMLMQQFEKNKQKQRRMQEPEINPMLKRFNQEMEEPYRREQQKMSVFEDQRKEKQVDNSLLQYAIKQSLNDTKYEKTAMDYIRPMIKPVQKFISDAVTNVIVPNIIVPKIQKKLEQSMDNTLIGFQDFLSGMGRKQASFSLENDFKYEIDDFEDEVFFQDEINEDKKFIPKVSQETSLRRGQLTIRQINQAANELHSSKQEFSIFVKVIQPVLLTFKCLDQRRNRPMTKLIVGDSTGIGVLFMNYYFEVKAGYCLKLDNCKLHRYLNSFEINHHRNISSSNIRPRSSILRVQHGLTLSFIRKVQRDQLVYDVKAFFNDVLLDCVMQFAKDRITIGQRVLRKPIIVSVCEVSTLGKTCVLGDYTGKINADLSNSRREITINRNDTLLIRNAKLQTNRGTILLVMDRASIIIKADRGFKFSHDMNFIPDKMLRGKVI